MGELNIKEQLNEYYYRYLNDITYDDLFNTHNEIKSFLERELIKGIIDQGNIKTTEALKMRIAVKANLLKYLNTNFNNDVYQKSTYLLNEYIKFSKIKEYNNMISYLENHLTFITKINEVVNDYNFYKCKIVDPYGNISSKNIEDCEEVLGYCKRSINKLEGIDNYNPFNDGAKFINIKEKIGLAFNELMTYASNTINLIEDTNLNDFIKNNLELVNEKYGNYNYAHIINTELEALSNCMIVLSPIIKEAILASYLLSKKNNKNLVLFDAKKIDYNPGRLIHALTKKDYDVFIYNVHALYSRKDDIWFEHLISYSTNKHNVYIYDDLGTKEVYNRLINICSNTTNLSKYNVSFTFIPLPKYNDVIELYLSKGMIDNNDQDKLEAIRKSHAFMGYAGLHDTIKAFIEGKNWFSIGSLKSHENYNNTFIKYYKNLATKSMLIDEDWKDVIELGPSVNITKYDYDKIKDIIDDKIKYILDLDIDIWTKAGTIVRYALLAGDDISSWKSLSEEEIKARVTRANELLYIVLEIDYRPTVEFQDEIGKDKWGGRCCEKGRLIQYKSKYLYDYDYVFKIICHECRHSFQHHVVDHQYDEKHLERFITKAMRKQWDANFKIYDADNPLYSAQVVEADANAFAEDSREKSDAYWHLLNI